MANLGTTFDATNIEPAKPFEVLPPGKYPAQIVNSETRVTKDGTGQYLWLELDVLEGPHKGRKLFDDVVKEGKALSDAGRISELDPRHSVERELLMATVRATAEQRGQVVELTNIFEGTIVGVGAEALTVSLDGSPSKIDDFMALLGQYGIVESQRTGRIALPRLDRGARVRAVPGTTTKGKAS